MMFYTNRDIRKMIVPLLLEQVLVMAVGMADVIMLSYVGESAVAGASLVDTVNILLINIFTALATGGSVVVGHCLGEKNLKEANKSAWQLLLLQGMAGLLIMVSYLLLHSFLLRVVFGDISQDVYKAASTYLVTTAFSMVFVAIYNGVAALFRSMGKTKTTMLISLYMNLFHVVLNAALIYGLKLGVLGAGISTICSRLFAAVLGIILLYCSKEVINLKTIQFSLPNVQIMKKILYVGIPNSLENSMFQLGKIVLLRLVATMGASAITANAVSGTIAMFNVLPGMAMNYALLTISAFCIGARDYEQAKFYTKKLVKITYACMITLSVVILLTVPYILKLYHVSSQTQELIIQIVRYHGFMAMFFWVPSFTISNTLRAAGDVVYPMVVAIISMWIFRIGAAYLLSGLFTYGLMGVWIAMTVDWIFRGTCYLIRYKRGKWQLL